MEIFFRDFLDLLQKLHSEIELVLTGLSQDALDWVPGNEMNSLAVLAVHVAGAERYWIGDVVAGESSDRDRDAEFSVRGVKETTLVKQLRDSLSYCRQVLERLNLEGLAATRVSPRNGREFTVGWSLAHVLEHTAIHAGHMQVTRQMWEQQVIYLGQDKLRGPEPPHSDPHHRRKNK